MTDKEKIKAEIERLKEKILNGWKSPEGFVSSVSRGELQALNYILSFIDSLEEPVSEDLEKEILRYKAEEHKQTAVEGQTWEFDWDDILLTIEDAARHFVEWQKQQLMKDAVDLVIEDASFVNLKIEGIEKDYKVKLIIIKET